MRVLLRRAAVLHRKLPSKRLSAVLILGPEAAGALAAQAEGVPEDLRAINEIHGVGHARREQKQTVTWPHGSS